ncbi:MAG: hypothetical protein OIN87_02775 [Candidatus Methanoperedens sp.]|nr:hypothetical protein [Candidatus Methanoperedens sp.]
MIRKITIILFLLTIVLLTVTDSSARPQYLTNLNEVYVEGSCQTCHIIPQGDGQRNFNNTMPQNGTFERRNRTASPNSDETSPGRNFNRTGSRNSNRSMARNSYGTLFENQPDHATDPDAALKAIGQPPSPEEATGSGTKAAQGFDIFVFVFGSSAGILFVRHH